MPDTTYTCPVCDAVDAHTLTCLLAEAERVHGFGSPEAAAVQLAYGDPR